MRDLEKMTFPDKPFEKARDDHIGHTKENPDKNCSLCRIYGWVEE